MQQTRLGRTNLMVSRTAFGALPIQRIPLEDAAYLLRKAFDCGITFFDTARGYTDSEEKMGHALSDVREKIVIATKSGAQDRAGLLAHLDESLAKLRTDYVDILQSHNPSTMPSPDDGPDGIYAGMLEAKAAGKIRHIGVSYHRRDLALAAVRSGLYDTLQFPLSAISSDEDLALIDECRKHNVGLIAMKALCGGLLTHAPSAFAFLRQYENVVPIWGVQREAELDEILALEANPPALDDAMWAIINKDRAELSDRFCRACGYCLPCPAGIPIPMAARMSLLLRRMPYQQFLGDQWRANMLKINDCTRCGHCKAHCPYDLDAAEILQAMLEDYQTFYEEHKPEIPSLA